MLIIKVEQNISAEELASLLVAQPKVIAVRNLTGAEQAVELILSLTEQSIPVIVAYIVGRLRANRHIEATYRGMKLKGVSESTVETLLKDLLKKDAKSSD